MEQKNHNFKVANISPNFRMERSIKCIARVPVFQLSLCVCEREGYWNIYRDRTRIQVSQRMQNINGAVPSSYAKSAFFIHAHF